MINHVACPYSGCGKEELYIGEKLVRFDGYVGFAIVCRACKKEDWYNLKEDELIVLLKGVSRTASHQTDRSR